MFVGKDVATALGYAKPQNALATHVDKEDKSTAPIQGTAYETRVTLINESGLETTGDRFMILCRITEPVPMVHKCKISIKRRDYKLICILERMFLNS